MVKRNKLDIIFDILNIIRENHNSIKPTPLLRKSNLSSKRFKEYFSVLLKKSFVIEQKQPERKVSLTNKGYRFLDKYKTIINFIDEFDL